MAYFSIHNHTEYSNIRLLDSINTVSKMFKRAVEIGLTGFCITDHECLSSHVQAIQTYQKMKDQLPEDFKLGLGDEIYLVDECGTDITMPYGYTHFILVAKNLEGHRALREISSQAWANSYHSRGMERVPVTKKQLQEIMKQYPGTLVASTACLGGELARLISLLVEAETNGEIGKANQIKSKINDFMVYCLGVFGKEDFYVEVQPSDSEDQVVFNKRVKSIAAFYGVKMIFTTDSHFISELERPIHKSFLNSKEGEREVDAFYYTAYMMRMEEIKTYLSSQFTDEEIETMRRNTNEIAAKIEHYDLGQKQIIPEVKIEYYAPIIPPYSNCEFLVKMASSEFDQDRYWFNECVKSLEAKGKLNPTYLSRLNDEAKELWNISETMGLRMTSYYNTMKLIIKLTWDEGNSLVGPARGSATGFLSCYLLEITQLDPIVWNLPHWRHLTETRPELPDIDFDTQAMRRKQILQAVKDFFGYENVLNIATFGTEGSKSSCLTACRGYRSDECPNGIDVDVAQFLTSMIPSERGQLWSLKDVVYGNVEKERRPVSNFVKEVEQYPGLLDIMMSIEGMVNKRSIHASGVYIYNHGYLAHNAMMKAPNGQEITQFNMNDSDYMGSLKYDFLTIEALDKIGVALDLLIKDGIIQDQGSLKATYDKYVHPDVLDYSNREMWDLMGSGDVINLFQFDTEVGSTCAQKVKPHSLEDAASANSLMRLMGERGGEQPVDRYIRMKNNIQLWYDEMSFCGLTKSEIALIEPHYLPVYGTPNTQEDMMETLMNEKITNFDLVLANKARKIVAKKKADDVEGFMELFYTKGMECGNRREFLEYIWNTCIKTQLGYSFSRNHTTPYTAIALQELNLYHNYPNIYWNTACLTVNAGSADEDAQDQKSTDYAKIATAIGDIASRGVVVSLADINRSDFGFRPDADANEIVFGLKGINNVGDDLVHDIISNRPYANMADFTSKVKVNKQAMIALIKGGAFDKLENKTRQQIMVEFIWANCDKKKRLTLQNLNGLIEANLLPVELDFERRTFNFNKALKAHCKKGSYYVLPEPFNGFFCSFFDADVLEVVDNLPAISCAIWDKTYKKVMDGIREWLKANHDEVLETYNKMIFKADWDKYAAGTVSAWEMEALCFYYNEHELAVVNREQYGISNFGDLNPEPVVDYYFKKAGKEIPIFKLNKIVGTVIGKNKTKSTVSILTTDGVVSVKFRPEYFAMFDKQMSEKQADGSKKIVEKSWFNRGSMIMLTGFRRGSQFVPKKYAKTPTHQLYKIDEVTSDGEIKIRNERYGSGE